MVEGRKMTRTSEHWFKNKSRVQTVTVVVELIMIASLLLWGAGNAAAQWQPRNSIRSGKWFQSGRQQPPPIKQIKKLDPNPVKGGGAGRNPNNPNPQRPANPLSQFPEEEQALVPRGIDRAVPLLYVFRRLNLSGEQRMKLRNLTMQTGNEIQVLRGLYRAQNIAYDEALFSRNFDPKVVEQRAAAFADAQAELIKVQARVMVQIRQILTPDQGARLRDLLIEERERQNQQPPLLPTPTPTPLIR